MKPIGEGKVRFQAGKADLKSLGQALGQRKIAGKEFCDNLNNRTKNMKGELICRFECFDGGGYEIITILSAKTSDLIKEHLNIESGSGSAGKVIVGELSREDLRKISIKKFADLGLGTEMSEEKLEKADRIIQGCCQSMGVSVVEKKING